jgi:hypothetical protein
MGGSRNLRLSAVEQSPVRKGGTGADAPRETIEPARVAERLGYERFRVAEHHDIQSIASTRPEIPISQVGAATSRRSCRSSTSSRSDMERIGSAS